MAHLTESNIEPVALDWLKSLGWQVAHGPGIAPGMSAAERQNYGEVVLEQRMRDAIARLNPDAATGAVDERLHAN